SIAGLCPAHARVRGGTFTVYRLVGCRGVAGARAGTGARSDRRGTADAVCGHGVAGGAVAFLRGAPARGGRPFSGRDRGGACRGRIVTAGRSAAGGVAQQGDCSPRRTGSNGVGGSLRERGYPTARALRRTRVAGSRERPVLGGGCLRPRIGRRTACPVRGAGS